MHKNIVGIMVGLALSAGGALATPPNGVTGQTFRNKLPVNIYATQWGPSPLFNLLMQTSDGDWGYDFVHTVNTFAPASAIGTPSSSGWHDHPVPIGFVQIIQGALWIQQEPHFNCLTYYPTGSVLIEGRGHIHNAYNFDKQIPAVLNVIWFLERYLTTTRTEQPDPITGDANVASPPPPLCADSPQPPAQ